MGDTLTQMRFHCGALRIRRNLCRLIDGFGGAFLRVFSQFQTMVFAFFESFDLRVFNSIRNRRGDIVWFAVHLASSPIQAIDY
jgi:hypothetical protein